MYYDDDPKLKKKSSLSAAHLKNLQTALRRVLVFFEAFPFSSDTYQEGSSEWRAQKRPSIYTRSRAVIGREPMGVTAKLYAVGLLLSGDVQKF